MGGMHGRGLGAHMAWGVLGGVCGRGGMHGGMCNMQHPPPPRGQILRLRHTVNERAVRILLECILVCNGCSILTIHN